MKKLQKLIQELENNFERLNVSNLGISSSNIGWHLDHCMKVILVISKNVEESEITNYRRSFNFKRSIIFLSGTMPRGKGKAPKVVQAQETVLLDDLKTQLALVKIMLQKFHDFAKNKNFKHPVFGVLNLKQTVKFFEIHTNHHLKIVRDINVKSL